jgi:hypothetical protein
MDEPALLAVLAQVTELAAVEPRGGLSAYYGERYQVFTHQVHTLRTNAARRGDIHQSTRGRLGAPSQSIQRPDSLTAFAGKAPH